MRFHILRSLCYVALSILLVSNSSAVDMVQVSSGNLSLGYDPGTGRLSLREKDEPLLKNATAAVAMPDSEVAASDARYTRRHERAGSPDPLLPDEQLVVFCKDQRGRLALEYRITLLRDRAAAVFEVGATNNSDGDLLVRHVEPVRALLEEGGSCSFGGKTATGRR